MSARTMSVSESAQPIDGGHLPLRLWLVDDNQHVRDLLADLLGGHEALHCPRQFESAEDAIEALAHETPPDVILTDLNMSGMTGIDAIAPIRALAPGTRVFIMTTFYDAAQAAMAKRCGAAAFFLKSAPVEEMIENLQRAPAPVFAASDWQNETAWRTGETPVSSGRVSHAKGAWFARTLTAFRTLLTRKKTAADAVIS